MRTTRWLAGVIWLSTVGCTSVLGDDYVFDLDEGAGGAAGASGSSGSSGSSGQGGDAGSAGQAGASGGGGAAGGGGAGQGGGGAGGSPFECGNQIREGAEECDGGDVNGLTCTTALGQLSSGTLGCLPDCKRDYSNCHYCGDDKVGTGEECDGTDLGTATCASRTGNANAKGDLACTPLCTFDASGCSFCGDGKLQTGEACDGTNLDGATCSTAVGVVATGTLGCSSSCALDTSSCQFCGNHVRDSSEDCEDSDLGGATCESVVGAGSKGTLVCSSKCGLDTTGCSPPTSCGDGTRDGSDQCDGADLGGATCATVLQRSGATGTLACAKNCTFDTSACRSCGDGVINNQGEQCDGVALGGKTCATVNPSATGTLACASDCTLDASGCSFCGDGKKNGGEVCDGADLGGASCASLIPGSSGTLGCSSTCTFDKTPCQYCGDGTKNGSEVCDGTDFGTASCATLVGFGSTGTLKCNPGCGTISTAACSAVVTCGDGVVDPSKGEQCDGSVPGGVTCATETGQSGATGTLSCTNNCRLDRTKCHYCGNNVRDNAGEVCDGTDLGGATCPPDYTGKPTCSPLTCQLDSSSCLCQAPRQECSGKCVDPGSDADNCGACGHSCLGAKCSKGACAATQVATGSCAPSAYVIDNDQGVMFVVGTNNNAPCLVRKDLSTGLTTPLSQDVALQGAKLIVADATSLYVATKGGTTFSSQLVQINRTTSVVTVLDVAAKRSPLGLCLAGTSLFLSSTGMLAGKTGTHHIVTEYPTSNPSKSAALLDLGGEVNPLRGAACTVDTFYFGVNSSTFNAAAYPIEALTLDGKTTNVGPTNQRDLSQIVLFKGSLYWTLLNNNSGVGQIATVATDGSSSATLLSDPAINPSGLAVDENGIYWVDAQTSTVNYLGLNGKGGRVLGSASTLPTSPQLSPQFVYYIAPTGNGPSLFRVPR